MLPFARAIALPLVRLAMQQRAGLNTVRSWLEKHVLGPRLATRPSEVCACSFNRGGRAVLEMSAGIAMRWVSLQLIPLIRLERIPRLLLPVLATALPLAKEKAKGVPPLALLRPHPRDSAAGLRGALGDP